jgi:glycosyltransferase involved in cell wall biosynthesis
VICVSNAIREYYGGNGDARYAVVPVGSGLHARLTQVSDARILDARRQWSLRPDDVVVGYMGRLVKDKGPEDLLDAIELLRRDFPRLRLLVVGTGQGQDGDVEEQLRQRVQREGLTSVIQFAGFQSDEALYYRLFDLFVLSSRYREAMPTSVIQAMMAGVPVVATRTGGTPEVVVDGETGLLVPPSAPTAIADALRRFLTDDALVQRITREAHERVNMHHREEVLTRRAEAVYTDAMTRSRSASAGDRRST